MLARDSSAIGLPQPHLNRTALCELPEAALDATYLQRRDELRQHLHATAAAKALRGAPLDGPALSDLVEALVAALNAQEFPTAGSMLEAFNQRLMMECSEAHAATLLALPLPVEEVCCGRSSSIIMLTHAPTSCCVLRSLHRQQCTGGHRKASSDSSGVCGPTPRGRASAFQSAP